MGSVRLNTYIYKVKIPVKFVGFIFSQRYLRQIKAVTLTKDINLSDYVTLQISSEVKNSQVIKSNFKPLVSPKASKTQHSAQKSLVDF